MGWLFIQDITRKELIEKIIKREENESGIWETKRHCARGNVLWSIVHLTRKNSGETETFIGCHLLQRTTEKLAHRKIISWGYKEMTESMGPCYYTCPLSYLDDVPVANETWREQVRKYHRKYQLGDCLTLEYCKIPQLTVSSIKPLLGIFDGRLYRVPRNLVASVTSTR